MSSNGGDLVSTKGPVFDVLNDQLIGKWRYVFLIRTTEG